MWQCLIGIAAITAQKDSTGRGWINILSGIRFIERLILGLYFALIGAGIAVFASAVPYLYAQEVQIRCGAFALTQLTLKSIIVGGMAVIVLLAVVFRVARFFVEIKLPGWLKILKVFAATLWVGAAWGGGLEFFNLISALEATIDEPPPLPASIDKTFDQMACRTLITTSHPHNWIQDHLAPQIEKPRQP